MLTLRRRDPGRRMSRFYLVTFRGDPLDGWAVVREWRRIG